MKIPLKTYCAGDLMKLLAIPLGCQKTATKWLVMLRCSALASSPTRDGMSLPLRTSRLASHPARYGFERCL
jgi:hypothetical protein